MKKQAASSERKVSTRTGGRREKRWPVGTPRPVDVHVGSRVRLRRTLLGMSQEKLGDAVGLTFQQIQKYERGANRIGASRLHELSKVLNAPVSFFFDDMPDDVKAAEHCAPGLCGQQQMTDPLSRRETIDLVRSYYKIIDPKVRKRLFELTKSLAAAARAG